MSQDSTKPARWAVDDKFAAVTDEDVSDDNPKFLANRLDRFMGEMRDRFDLLEKKLEPLFTRTHNALDDIGVRLNRLEKDRDSHSQRITALEQAAKRRLKGRK
jgi:hypothetical protein